MKTATLKLETLHFLDADLTRGFDAALQAMVADCKKRPATAAFRTLTLELKIKPHPSDADDVLIAPVMKTKEPPRVIEAVTARHATRSQLQFDFEDDD